MRTASGLYMGLTAPGGLTTYYDPLRGLGFTRDQEDALNTYSQMLNPFEGWTLGAYAHEAGQFGVGELKGSVNFVAGSLVSVSPALWLADDMTGGRLSSPVAAVGEGQGDGADFIQVPLFVGSALVGDPEAAVAADSRAAVNAAGAGSKVAINPSVAISNFEARNAAAETETFITYVIKNKKGEVVYVGKSSGIGTPDEVLAARMRKGHGHYFPEEGDTREVIAVQGNKDANAGAEDVWYEYHRLNGANLRNGNAPLDFGRMDRRIKSVRKIKAYSDDLRRP